MAARRAVMKIVSLLCIVEMMNVVVWWFIVFDILIYYCLNLSADLVAGQTEAPLSFLIFGNGEPEV